MTLIDKQKGSYPGISFKFIQLLSTTTYHQRVLQQLVSDPSLQLPPPLTPEASFSIPLLIIHGVWAATCLLKSPAICPECCSNYTSMASRPKQRPRKPALIAPKKVAISRPRNGPFVCPSPIHLHKNYP
ncbi:hypothetical protein CDAR_43571 [Caerostris darwini]|uniref:Uncharacterized protein n=1 Tax=Caerostris darwini TaxID=1538125 RepID=A0AAV4WGG2_9ARAC|nr:hypothetical protein CDAR_43571 [Caerostris darwini]